MMGRFSRTAGALGLSVVLAVSGLPGMAAAEMVGTESAVESAARADRVERVQALIERDDVAQRLVELGVDPAYAKERVAGLTDAELARMESRMDELPAGAGAVEVIGILFVVLLILELLGITDLFTAI